MSFLSEDLIVPPHELLKCGISQLEYKHGICPFSKPQYSCVHLGSFVPCIVSITTSILFILNLSKDFCRCVTVQQLLCPPPGVTEMISAPALYLTVLGGRSSLNMLQNTASFPILYLSAVSHGFSMRSKPANSLRDLTASVVYLYLNGPGVRPGSLSFQDGLGDGTQKTVSSLVRPGEMSLFLNPSPIFCPLDLLQVQFKCFP